MNTTVATTEHKQDSAGALVPMATLEQVRKIANIQKETTEALALHKDEPAIQGIVMASGLNALRNAFTEAIMADLMQLAESPLGFQTDRKLGTKRKVGDKWVDVQPYPTEVIRDCLIDGLMMGFRITGNEINIISGKAYVTKDGLYRALAEWPGFAWAEWKVGKPNRGNGVCYLNGYAKFYLDNEEHEIRLEDDDQISVKLYGTDTDDILKGKAERKLFFKVYRFVNAAFDRAAKEKFMDDDDAIDGKVIDTSKAPKVEEAVEQHETEVDVKKVSSAVNGFLNQTLPAAESIGEVKEILAKALKRLNDLQLDTADHMELEAIVTEACNFRMEEIRESRGQNSNGH